MPITQAFFLGRIEDRGQDIQAQNAVLCIVVSEDEASSKEWRGKRALNIAYLDKTSWTMEADTGCGGLQRPQCT